jgi:phage terminase large subunit
MTSVSFPHLRKGVLKDWRIVMEQYELYNVNDHTRTEQTYHYPTGSYMEFFSVDDHLKVRGPRRDILFINEANLINYDTFLQLLLRTRICVFIDYNPADEFHWIYDKVLTRTDCYYIQTTYKDNPFLPDEQIKEIENLKDADANYWKVYGLGERGHSEGVIYTHWNAWQGPGGITDGQTGYGLDFGYNNPTALCKVVYSNNGLYVSEELYESKITNSELINALKQLVSPYDPIYCDAAEPQRIEEIKRAGFKAIAANKDVKAGIDFIKSRKLFIHQGSVNLLKEIKSYKFKVNKNRVGNTPEEPLKLNDHAMDAMRYAAISFKKPKSSLNVSFK